MVPVSWTIISFTNIIGYSFQWVSKYLAIHESQRRGKVSIELIIDYGRQIVNIGVIDPAEPNYSIIFELGHCYFDFNKFSNTSV